MTSVLHRMLGAKRSDVIPQALIKALSRRYYGVINALLRRY